NSDGTINQNRDGGGGAGTVYWKKSSDALGELVVDNGGGGTSGWTTPLQSQGALRLLTWVIDGRARVSAPFPVRVSSGDPNYFLSLINSNYLHVGSLRVNGQWVYGDLIDLEINWSNAQPHIT